MNLLCYDKKSCIRQSVGKVRFQKRRDLVTTHFLPKVNLRIYMFMVY